MNLPDVQISDLGRARQIKVSKDNTVIVDGAGDTNEIKARVAEIKNTISVTTSDYDKEKLQERLARLSGGVAVIRVGAQTEVAMKEQKLRVEDALNATRAAVEEGIVAGGGTAYVNAIPAVEKLIAKLSGDEKTGAQIIAKALQSPIRQIAENAGVDGSIVFDKIRNSRKLGYGYNAYTETYCDMIPSGIVDPTKVARAALENAASISACVLTTESLVADKPDPQADAAMPNTRLQMLLRGQNLLGYKHYHDDVVEKFVELSIKNGIDIIRIFDALNDFRNLGTALDATMKYATKNTIASGCISYTQSPVHTVDKYIEMCKELKTMGFQTITLKDMAGTMSPFEAEHLIKGIKDAIGDTPVILHTHCTTGMAYMTLTKAIESGIDVIDCATSCFSNGTSQPATETMFYALQQYGIETGLNEDVINKVNNYFKPIKQKYIDSGRINPKSLATDAQALVYKVPGGMATEEKTATMMARIAFPVPKGMPEIPNRKATLTMADMVTKHSRRTEGWENGAAARMQTEERIFSVFLRLKPEGQLRALALAVAIPAEAAASPDPRERAAAQAPETALPAGQRVRNPWRP